MTAPTKKKSPWPPSVRKKVYDAMAEERSREMGTGFVRPKPFKDERFEYQDRVIAAYSLYTNSATDRLQGMAVVVGLVEGKDPQEILNKVRGW